jgi:predicted DNA binding CopG/RHH family protein
MTWMRGRSATTWSAVREENDAVKKQKKQLTSRPKFISEDEEAAWWAGAEGREFLKKQSALGTREKQKGSALVASLSRTGSVQIALRLPAPDVAKAREIAGRKGIGYQTLLKMLVHEGLQREARRQ